MLRAPGGEQHTLTADGRMVCELRRSEQSMSASSQGVCCVQAGLRSPPTFRKKDCAQLKKDEENHQRDILHSYILPSRKEVSMANYAIMRMEKRKLATVGRICKHNERLKKEYKSNPDIDPEKRELNYHIIRPKTTYRNAVLARIEEAGARRRKDSVVLQDCFIGATPDWIKAKTAKEQEAYFRYAAEFFVKKIGKENIVSAVVHMDEATPHMHLCFVPITANGRLSSKDIVGGPTGLSKWQDEFYEHMSERYPDLTRGTPARVSHRQHIPVYMFKNAGLLYDHYEEIVQAIKDIGVINSSKKKDAAIALLGRYAPEMAKLKEQLKATDKQISYLEGTVDLERQNTRYFKNENAEKGEVIREKNQQLYELNRKQKELEKIISMIPPEVLEQIRRREIEASRKGGREKS